MDAINILFDNGNQYTIDLIDSPLKNRIVKSLKHLQHVKLPFSMYDSPLSHNLSDAITQLTTYAGKLNIDIDLSKLNDQIYLNNLHIKYEKNYYISPSPDWLMYHESIHIIEHFLPNAHQTKKSLHFDYREHAGKLSSNFLPTELANFTTTILPGDVVIGFNELGKTPWDYWTDQEPDDLARFCQLAKPMLRFNFALRLYFDFSKTDQFITDEFVSWYNKYKKQWCEHWGISDWPIDNIVGLIKVGHCNQFEDVYRELESGATPEYLKLISK